MKWYYLKFDYEKDFILKSDQEVLRRLSQIPWHYEGDAQKMGEFACQLIDPDDVATLHFSIAVGDGV